MNDQKFAELMQDREFVKKILSISDIREVQKLFKEKGLDLSIKELQDISNSISSIANKLVKMNEELADDSLEEVSGGGKLAKASAVAFTGLLIAGTMVACAYGYERGSQNPNLDSLKHNLKSSTIGTSFSEDLEHVSNTIWSGWKLIYKDIKNKI